MKRLRELSAKIIEDKTISLFVMISGIMLSILVLDIGIRYISNQYHLFYEWTHFSPLFFSVSWLILIVGILMILPKKARMITYGSLVFIMNIYVLAEIIHLKVLDRFFGIYDLFLAGEGAGYFLASLKMIDLKTIGLLVLSISIAVITLLIMKYRNEYATSKKYYSIVIIVVICLFSTTRYLALDKLGEAVNGNGFDITTTVRNVYNDFNNPSKNMEVAGLIEKPIREVYLFLKEELNQDKTEYKIEATNYFEDRGTLNSTNEMSGILKDKNLVFIMLESIDSWLVTEELMPTLTMMEKTGWNFTSRYAPAFGGGMTFNSEFAANTGTYSLNNGMAAYNFDHNDYSKSLPSLFQTDDYLVRSVHANNGSFYNRKSIHLSMGYQHHYALRDMNLKTEENYFLDKVLATDDEIYRYIVPESGKFMSFVITYTGHMPYSNENDKCDSDPYGLSVEGDEALSCIRNLVRSTDEFLTEMIGKLEAEDKLDDTVFVLFTDHYTYAYPDQDYVEEEKAERDPNLIQNVPFVIWGNNLEAKEITTVMDTADILPTVANLFGLENYDASNYLATDVFSPYHDNYVYFADGSWFDGEIYYQGQEVPAEKQEYVDHISEEVMTKIKINDAIILGNYYKK